MKRYIEPERSLWPSLTKRVQRDDAAVEGRVAEILAAVRKDGDAGLRAVVQAIDGVVPADFRVGEAEFDAAEKAVPAALQAQIRAAYGRIRTFHEKQRPGEVVWDDGAGIVCRRRYLPVGRAGLYVPGGSAPLFSTVLMLAIPAAVAGCGDCVLCTPPDREGRIAPAILFAARLCGIRTVFKLGGAQAVAAMAYGTETVPKCDKIFGPGNRYVLKAKQLVNREGVAIDMPAGPSEVMVLSDAGAVPAFVAADLLSQAEHGPDSQVMLVCADGAMADAVEAEVARQKARLPRQGIVDAALAESRILVFADPADRMAFANAYAPEHLILATENAASDAEAVTAAGSVFIGPYAPESAGDYASGTNHTLPTLGLATAWSGLGVDSFLHAVTYQQISREGLARIGDTVVGMARAEGLDAHAEAVRIRLEEKYGTN